MDRLLQFCNLTTVSYAPQGLVERYIAVAARQAAGQAPTEALLLSSAAVELLRGHSLLAEHAVDLGYTDRLLALMDSRLPAKPGACLNVFSSSIP